MRWLALVVLTACNASVGADMDAAPDAVEPDAFAAPDAPVPLGPWGDLIALAFPATGDDDPTATADLLELYFNRSSDIYRVTRTSVGEAWGTPAIVAELSSVDADTTPEVSSDGLTMYLASSRTGTLGSNDIFVSTRASRSDAWATPVHVPELSSTAGDGAVATTADQLVLVMDSGRIGASLDLFSSQRASTTATWSTPVPLDNVNTTGSSEGNPMLSSDGLTLFFDSNRTGNGEIYTATRSSTSSAFSLPQRIEELADPASDADPWVSPDGRTMYFTSNRDGTTRIWQATRSPL